MKIDLKLVLPIIILMLSAHFSVMAWIAATVSENGQRLSAVETAVSALPPKWMEDRIRENSDDIDEIRKHKHVGMNIAMLDKYEDE
jgi:uncharacterized protein YacL (UPF0231 family)